VASASPSILACRDPKSIRSCLTYFSNIFGGEVLDLRKLQFIDPAAMVLLHHHAARFDKNVSLYLPDRTEPRAYIQDHLSWRLMGYALKNPNAFPLRYVARELDLAKELGKWREMLVETTHLGEETARGFSSTMSEVLTNSFTHGRTAGPCIVAGQTFKKKGRSHLAAVDLGQTIPRTLRESNRYPGEREDHEWILLSLERGVTCKSRETNRGYGLFYLRNHVAQNGGCMYILSGAGIVSVLGAMPPDGTRLGRRYAPFPGTMIILDLRTETL
jgi:hypothetical protein